MHRATLAVDVRADKPTSFCLQLPKLASPHTVSRPKLSVSRGWLIVDLLADWSLQRPRFERDLGDVDRRAELIRRQFVLECCSFDRWACGNERLTQSFIVSARGSRQWRLGNQVMHIITSKIRYFPGSMEQWYRKVLLQCHGKDSYMRQPRHLSQLDTLATLVELSRLYSKSELNATGQSRLAVAICANEMWLTRSEDVSHQKRAESTQSSNLSGKEARVTGLIQ